ASVYIISGPELKSKWVGEGEENIRRLFAKARSTAPSVIVFDEFDSIASRRGLNSDHSASEASHSMVNQLLTELDGFRREELIFVIGTTNFPESLDPAFLRPGRFEYKIEIPYPEWEDRRAIIELYNQKLETNLDEKSLEMLTAWTSKITDTATYYTGDHINALMRNIKRHLLRESIDMIDDKVLLDWLKSEHKKHNLEEVEEKIVAVHEIGHTLMYHKYQRLDEVKQVTIESGITDALGMVEIKDKKNQNLYTEKHLRENIGTSLGGYVAEKIIFGQLSTGASVDLRNATHIAEEMVATYGMGNLAVPRVYIDDDGRLNPYFHNVVSPQIDLILVETLSEVTNYFTQHKETFSYTKSSIN
ncbi:AAA family ATPase, partial [bacterium]